MSETSVKVPVSNVGENIVSGQERLVPALNAPGGGNELPVLDGNVGDTEAQIILFKPQELDANGAEENRRLEVLKAYKPTQDELGQLARANAESRGQVIPAAAAAVVEGTNSATPVVEGTNPATVVEATKLAEAATTAATGGVDSATTAEATRLAAKAEAKEKADKDQTPADRIRTREAARANSREKLAEARKKLSTSSGAKEAAWSSKNSLPGPTEEENKKYLKQNPSGRTPLTPERRKELESKADQTGLTDEETDELGSEKIREYYQEIETKLKDGEPLTEEELNNYEAKLNAEEVRDREDEMENIGNEIIKSNGIAKPETRSKMSAFLDKITGGEFSKNGALKSLVDFSGMSDGEKKEATARLQKALEKFTPKDAQFVKRELQVLMQMEFQARAMVRNLTELAHQAWDIKDFINKHKKALDPRMDSGEDLSDQEAANKRMKWTMVMQLLNDKKSQIMQSANSARILHDLYADSKNKIEFKLGLKGHISYIARSVWNRVGGEVNTQIDSMSNDFRTAEGNRRPAESRKGPPLDLTQFKP